jgi:UDPglucose 6-dehydrogenase
VIQDAQERGLDMPVMESARALNDTQPAYCVDRLEAVLGPLAGDTVAILGLGFRPEVKEHLMSPAFGVRTALQARGARAVLVDPLYSTDEIAAHGFDPASLDDLTTPTPSLPAIDALILVTAHKALLALDWVRVAARGVRVALDGRNAWDARALRDAGLTYLGVGR